MISLGDKIVEAINLLSLDKDEIKPINTDENHNVAIHLAGYSLRIPLADGSVRYALKN